ncbi:Alpha-1,3-galactosidase B [Tritrichomonas foetus]|uniref:Alpha-1,3-galactosidase B n=1 Tax=Tritrichomonas foetus TaxID=1144522 RepID=A0A1J4JYP3_9EUKA|nr:Alpha-1,3-galactosidase B [Tritrichomonas foetus]|eukprot:OHT03600.1 Alpha-1,3-galactosidase B [Tritrichomonas foetus]
MFTMILFFIFAKFSLSAEDPVVSDNDIFMTKQTWGECRRDVSVNGNKLTIKGVEYSSGIGTHATSMIPVTIPNGAKSLSGLCGIDDEVTSRSSVEFQILSGSEVLWRSGVIRNGDDAAKFTVPVPEGSHKLYLIADEVDTNDNDHADWVDLHWDFSRSEIHDKEEEKLRNEQKVNTNEITSHQFHDKGPEIRKMITQARAKPGTTIFIEKGEYHFYRSGALNLSFYISNHEQSTFQPICIPLVDLEDVTIDCGGSTFIFHNLVEPFLVMDSKNVTIRNVIIDSYRTFYTDMVVTDLDYFSTTVKIDKEKFPYVVENGKIVFVGEGFTVPAELVIAYEQKTKRILPGIGGLNFNNAATENDDGTVTFAQNLKKNGVQPGDFLTLRSTGRPHPTFVVYRSYGTIIEHVTIHDSFGMALMGQRSTDITYRFIKVTYGTPDRCHSSSMDSCHFSNMRGHIQVNNNLFEGMLDDSINIHCTSLKIAEILNQSCVKLQYIHHQSYGFETFLPGEKIQFIKSKTLQLSDVRIVKAVRKLSPTEFLVEIEGTIPSDIVQGDSAENGDYYASVTYENNIVRSNIARGCLFTTPKKVRVFNNTFEYVSGSAILLAGDAAFWYESGNCEDVLISGNRFVNSLTTKYEFTNAIFSFYPTATDLDSQTKYYHRNVRIVNNTIETFDVPLIYSISTDTIYFADNQIIYNEDFPGWNEKAFQLVKSKNCTISNNVAEPAKEWTMDDFDLDNTDPSEVHIL